MKQRFYYLGQRRERWFFRPRSIPEPTVRHWNHDPENILLRSAIGKAVFTVIYFAFNAYIIIVPLIPPYVNGAGVKQEVKGWYYIVIVLAIIAVGTIYYYSVFGLTTDAEGDLEHDNRHKTLLRFARAYPVLHEEPRHDPDYGVRRWVEVENPSLVSLSSLPFVCVYLQNS
jgi:hypothetical protein